MLKRVDLLFPTLLLGRSELAFGLVTDCFDVDVDVEIEWSLQSEKQLRYC